MSKLMDEDKKEEIRKPVRKRRNKAYACKIEYARLPQTVEASKKNRREKVNKSVVAHSRDNTEYLELIEQMNMKMKGK